MLMDVKRRNLRYRDQLYTIIHFAIGRIFNICDSFYVTRLVPDKWIGSRLQTDWCNHPLEVLGGISPKPNVCN